jgi:acyl carrier protein
MGLIMHIRALVNGNIVVSMSPQIWLRMPELLFRAVSRYGNAVVNMPNFGFEYCLKRIKDEDLAGLDLSGWKILSNGSEPVKVASMERFYQKFAPYGFRRDALKVSYGMAENIAAVSMTPSGRMPRADWVSMAELYTQKKAIPVNPESPGAEAIASCGYPYPGVELAIVDQEWKRLADREVGEIIIRSDTLFDGYYLTPQDAEDSFRDGWFRTGDIGYMIDGELFVCDRKKDLIIVGGRNIHPQAIENIAADIFGPFAGRYAAFGVSDQTLGTELPVLVIEQRKQVEGAEKQNLIQQVRKQVLEELDVAISDIRMVPKGWVIKTTSGKVARTANREKYLSEIKSDADEQKTISADALVPEQVKQNLINLFEKVLGITGIGEKDNFFLLGGDSLSALRLLIEIEKKFGRDIPVAQFFQQPTVGHLVEILCKGTHKETNAESDLKPWWRNKSASSQITRARLLMLFSAGLGRIKAKAREKLTNITPAWIFERKLSKYIFSMIRVYFLRKFYKLIENPLQSKDDFLQSYLVCEVPYIIKKELKKRLNQKLSERWRPTVNMATMEESYRNGKGVIIVGWHSHIWAMALLANVVQDILKPNYYNYVGRSKRLIPKASEELLKKDKKKIRMMIFLDQLMECKKTLAKKGVVFILPDGYAGLSHGISLPFHGRMRAFRAGFAELAVETGAAVIPVSLAMDVRARKLIITSLNPLEVGTSEMPRAERVEGLVKQYVSFLKQEWTRSPALIPYGRMRKHIDLSKA